MLSVVAQYGVTLALRSPAGKGMSFDELQNAMREINRLEADLTALDGGGPSGLTGDLSARRGAVRPADAAADLEREAAESARAEEAVLKAAEAEAAASRALAEARAAEAASARRAHALHAAMGLPTTGSHHPPLTGLDDEIPASAMPADVAKQLATEAREAGRAALHAAALAVRFAAASAPPGTGPATGLPPRAPLQALGGMQFCLRSFSGSNHPPATT